MRFEDYRPSRRQAAVDSSVAIPELVRDPIDAVAFSRHGPSEAHARIGSGLSWIFAALVHAAVIGGLAFAIEGEVAGSGGTTLDALNIEVSIVAASALESRRPETADSALNSTPPDDQDGETALAANEPPRHDKSAEAQPQPEIQAVPDPTPVQSELAIIVSEKEPEQSRDVQKPDDTKVEASLASETAQATTGSIAVTAAEQPAVAPTRAAAAVSRGTVNRYAQSVADVLAKSRPKSTAARSKGTVKVVFAIAEDGRAELVRVTSSSGDKKLDEVALAAIGSVAFPPPPPGMTIAQRTYEIPYHFR